MTTKVWQDLEILDDQNWISSHFRGRGNFSFSGQLRFSGDWKGSIESTDPGACLFVLEGARIEGQIKVARVVVDGSLADVDLSAEVFEAGPMARVEGRVSAKKLSVAEGAVVQGRILSQSANESQY